MPKPLINKANKTSTTLSLNQTKTHAKKSQILQKSEIDRILREKRSPKYMSGFANLDVGGHVHNQEKVKSIIDAIRQEFPMLELTNFPLGYVSICYLDDPYEVHVLSVSGEIVEHYKRGQKLPGELEKARAIALRGGYEFIEVYYDCCRAVSSDGRVSVIPC